MRQLLFLLLIAAVIPLFAYDVVVVSDTHYDAKEFHPGVKKFEGSTKRNLDAWEKRMPKLLKTYRKLAEKAAFVIHCGDLAHGNFSKKDDAFEIRAVTQGIQAFQQDIPGNFYCVRGNHETYCVNPAEASDKVIADHLKRVGIQPSGLHYALVHEGDLYVFIDSNRPDLNFIKATLAAHPDARHTFFITHHPVLSCTRKLAARNQVFRKAKDKYRELLQLLARRNAVILCGHIHQTTLVRAKFPEGTITQVSVYSLPVDANSTPEQQDYPGQKYLIDYLKQPEKEIPAFYLELFRKNYRMFTHYMPGPGVCRLSVLRDRITFSQYSFSGKLCHTFDLFPEPQAQPSK